MTPEDRTNGKRCEQCGSANPEHGFDTQKVIHIKWNPVSRKQYCGETLFTVCKGTLCGAHLQMAHEG